MQIFHTKNKYSSKIELIKWLGIVAMTSDHIGKLFYNQIDILRMVGRWAFPIFGFVLVYNFIYNTKNKKKYIKRIALAAVLFESIYYIVTKVQFNNYTGLNIFFIYALTLSILYLYELSFKEKNSNIKKKIFFFVFLLLSILISTYIDYHLIGLLLTISFYFSLKNNWFFILTLLLLILLNFSSTKYILATLSVLPIGFLITKIDISIPRLKYFFYLYYPLHLLLFGLFNFFYYS